MPKGVRGRVAIVGVVVFVIGIISGPASGFTFVYGEGVLKIRPDVVALVVTLSALTGLLGLLASRYFARVFGRRWTVALGTLATAATSAIAYGGGKTAFIIGYMSGVAAGGLLGAGHRGHGHGAVLALVSRDRRRMDRGGGGARAPWSDC